MADTQLGSPRGLMKDGMAAPTGRDMLGWVARGEVAMAVGVIGVILLLIVPVPTVILDLLLAISLVILLGISRPLRPWKVGLAAAMGGWYALTMVWDFPRDYFELVVPDTRTWLVAAVATVGGGLLVATVPRWVARRRAETGD